MAKSLTDHGTAQKIFCESSEWASRLHVHVHQCSKDWGGRGVLKVFQILIIKKEKKICSNRSTETHRRAYLICGGGEGTW